MTSLSEKFLKTIPLGNADSKELERISREGLLSLSLPEMQTIQDYFRKLGRDPTDAELETLAQTWSEHCVHKTLKGRYTYSEEGNIGTPVLQGGGVKTYSNLLKETIVETTEKLKLDWCLSVFKDNAGIIELDEEDAVAFKVETHNHPSALEPYGGAGTGIGGVIRDVLGCGLGAKPILNTDVFCFGSLQAKAQDLPQGALHPKRIAQGVVSGVRDYGNRMGIPTANGAVLFDAGYNGNPLVYCGTVGLIPKNAIDKKVEPGDLVVVVGGRTGRDGIHGATFSSAPLESGLTCSVVQIGHAIMEKKFMDVLLAARDRKLYRSITDCGAGGFSSAIGELGKDTGVKVDMGLAPLKYSGLEPWEIWVSESQERMVLAVPPDNWSTLKTLFVMEDVEAVTIGEFTSDKRLTVTYHDQVVVDIEMDFLHDGVPVLDLKAVWTPNIFYDRHHNYEEASPESALGIVPDNVIPAEAGIQTGSPIETFGDDVQASQSRRAFDIGYSLAWLLKHPAIASKEVIVRQYDHEVQGGMVIKPFMGFEHDGPTDACVFRPKLNQWQGVAVANGMNPEVGKIDPYIMAKMAVDEAYRNLLCVGGGLKRAAILDNFCWGDAKDPIELGGLVRAAEGCKEAALAYKLPFISGKDSFNNTWKSNDGRIKSIPPTLLISSLGVINDVRHCVNSCLKEEKGVLYLLGNTQHHVGGTLINQLWKKPDSKLPDVDFPNSTLLFKKLQSAFKQNLILSCHDLSEGGLAITAAEMAFGSAMGARINIPKSEIDPALFLFTETPSRFLVEVSLTNGVVFEQLMGTQATLIGETTADPDLVIAQGEHILFKDAVKNLKAQWKDALGSVL